MAPYLLPQVSKSETEKQQLGAINQGPFTLKISFLCIDGPITVSFISNATNYIRLSSRVLFLLLKYLSDSYSCFYFI